MHKFNYTGDFNSSDNVFFKVSEGLRPNKDCIGNFKSKSLNLSVIKEEQDQEKLEILRGILVSVNLENNAEKIKANNEYFSEELENSRLKNEILGLESQILELKSLKTPEKKSENRELKNKLSDQDTFSQVNRSISLKNIGHNLQYLEERLTTLQIKTHKSHLKLNFYKNKYSHQIPELKKSFNTVQSRIETLESEYFHLTSSLQILQSQNNSLSEYLSSNKPKLNSLHHKSRQLFRALSSLQPKIIKKPLNYPI